MYTCTFLPCTGTVQVSQAGNVPADQHVYGYWGDTGVSVGDETTGTDSGHSAATTHHRGRLPHGLGIDHVTC